MDDKLKLAPSDEMINRLKDAANNGDNRNYNRLIDQVDWKLASAKCLDKMIGIALAFVDMRRAKQLTEIGLECFPENEVFLRVWPLFNPPPARVGKAKWRSSAEALDNSMKWVQEHAQEYKPGHWLAVKSGQLIAEAPTLNELDNILDALGGSEIVATNSIVHQVVA